MFMIHVFRLGDAFQGAHIVEVPLQVGGLRQADDVMIRRNYGDISEVLVAVVVVVVHRPFVRPFVKRWHRVASIRFQVLAIGL